MCLAPFGPQKGVSCYRVWQMMKGEDLKGIFKLTIMSHMELWRENGDCIQELCNATGSEILSHPCIQKANFDFFFF